jgi:anti-anti-sigma factor
LGVLKGENMTTEQTDSVLAEGREPDYLFSDLSEGSRVVRVVICGEFDLGTAEQLQDQLREIVERGQDVELDMADLTFIDSSGLRAIVGARNEIAEGQRFEIVLASAQALRVLGVTGLRPILGPHDNASSTPVPNPEYEAALAALREAEEANTAALAANEHPPVGEGALMVLRRRVDAALDTGEAS